MMKGLLRSRSPSQSLRVWAVLGACVVSIYGIGIVVSIYTFKVWEADAQAAGRMMYVTLGEHLIGAVREWSFLALLAGLGFALALRGRRVLFAAPALAYAIVPMLMTRIGPGLNDGFSQLASEFGTWVRWAATIVSLTLVLTPGAVVKGAELRHNPLFIVALGVMAVPAWLIGYYVIIYFSYSGYLEMPIAVAYVAAFFVGAAIGLERPLWPWAIIAAPLLLPSIGIRPLLDAQGVEGLATGAMLLLGAVSVPIGLFLQRGWQPIVDPQKPPSHHHQTA